MRRCRAILRLAVVASTAAAALSLTAAPAHAAPPRSTLRSPPYGAIVERRDDLVKTRARTVNRLHVVLTRLVSAGASPRPDADRAAELLRTVRPRDSAGNTLRGLAADLVSEIRHLHRRITKARRDMEDAVAESGNSITDLCGIGTLNAGKILARVGSIHRFRSAGAFASYTGTAPIEASSGDVVRHRLSRAGDRQVTASCAPWPSPRLLENTRPRVPPTETHLSWDVPPQVPHC